MSSLLGILKVPPTTAPGTFPTNGLLDNFNRANEGPPPSASWGGKIHSVTDGLKVVSNECNRDGSSGFWSSYWGASFNANCEAYATISSTDLTGASNYSVYARVVNQGTSAPDGYAVEYDANAQLLKLYRVDDGVSTTLDSISINLNSGTGDKIGILCVGTTISSWYKQAAGAWTMADSVTDSAYNSSGKIGLWIAGNGVFDDFGGGNV